MATALRARPAVSVPNDPVASLAQLAPTPTREPMVEQAGWLSPDGQLYPCAYNGHDVAAASIMPRVYGRLGYRRDLEVRGWLHIECDGVVTSGRQYRPTHQQREYLLALVAQAGPPHWRRCLQTSLEFLFDDLGVWS